MWNNDNKLYCKIEDRKVDSDVKLKELKEASDINKYYLLKIKKEDFKDLHAFCLNQRRYEECNTLESEVNFIFH